MNISLRRGEKIYINGAVFRVDRKVCIEIMNDVTFLLENHVLQATEATTPLKQLYFVVQLMLMSPNDIDAPMEMSRGMILSLNGVIDDRRIIDGLAKVAKLIEEKRMFDALKSVRALFPIEAEILAASAPSTAREKVA
jgi:flagellar biosynthesis repressor protein FlbT